MSSSLASALARLDDCVQTIQSQVDRLHSGLDFDDAQLRQIFAQAQQHAASVRELVGSECPDARWRNRQALNRLIIEAQAAAQERERQERCAKLSALASELSAGRVQHRFEARATALNSLRMEAVAELEKHASSQEPKELPGPDADEWLGWACTLQEESEPAAINTLRQHFAAVERFASQMEDKYWVRGQGQPVTPPRIHGRTTAEPAEAFATPIAFPTPASRSAAAGNGGSRGHNSERTSPRDANSGGGSAAAISRPQRQDRQAATATATAFVLDTVPIMTYCHECGVSYSGVSHVCDNRKVVAKSRAEDPMASTHVDAVRVSEAERGSGTGAEGGAGPVPLSDAPEQEFQRLKALLEQRQATGEPVLEEEATPSFLSALGRKRVFVSAVAAGVVGLVAIFALMFHFTARASTERPQTAATAVAPVVSGAEHDAQIQKDIDQKLATLKDIPIQATVQAGIVTLDGQVASKEDLLKAEDLVSEASGVKIIRNNVQINAKAKPAKR